MTHAPEPTVLRGQLLLPGGLTPGTLVVQDGRIAELRPEPHAPTDVLILPGFVDTHVHGGGGDTMDGAAGVRTLAHLHARYGTTTLLPTTITAPWPQVIWPRGSGCWGSVRWTRRAPRPRKPSRTCAPQARPCTPSAPHTAARCKPRRPPD